MSADQDNPFRESQESSGVRPTFGIPRVPPKRRVVVDSSLPLPSFGAPTPSRASLPIPSFGVPTPPALPMPLPRASFGVPTPSRASLPIPSFGLPTPPKLPMPSEFVLPASEFSLPPASAFMHLPMPKKDVELLPTQVENVQNHMQIFRHSHFSIDNSVMGAGKTHMTSWLAQQLGLPHMIVIAPAGVEHVWDKVSKLYGIPLATLSYESLAIRKAAAARGRASHTLLSRGDGTGESEDSMIYYPTEDLANRVTQGTFFVFDEFQKIKNANSDNHRAAKAIVRFVCEPSFDNPSKIIFLSASPFDDDRQIVNFLKMVNIIRSPVLYRQNNGIISLLGAGELRDFCLAIDREATENTLAEHRFEKSTMIKTCAQLYKDVVAKHYTTAAPPPSILSTIYLDCKNGYYNLSTERTEGLSRAVASLHGATHYNARSQDVDTREADWGAITLSLVEIELNKVEIFARKADEVLASNSNAKVCIMLNFRGSLRILRGLLAAYNPLILDGSVPKQKRGAITTRFQQPDTEYRLLICNIVVGALGLDLDDTIGTFPRYFLISPGYKAMVLHQATHRPFRANTKSTPYVRFVFGKCGREETSILNALARRKEVMKSTVLKQLRYDTKIKFPGEYEQEIEPDFDIEKLVYEIEVDKDEREEDEAAVIVDTPVRQPLVGFGVPGAVVVNPAPPAFDLSRLDRQG